MLLQHSARARSDNTAEAAKYLEPPISIWAWSPL